MTELPASFYSAIGILLVMNFATLGSLIVFIFKVGMFVSETKHGISDSKDTGIRAHKRIDKLEEKV